jgi:hypothetical protein
MTQMVRKQIYIEPRQEALLKRLAEDQGVSEAELIRQAIDRRVGRGEAQTLPDDRAWEEAYRTMQELQARGPLAGQERAWRREDLYEERLSHHGHDAD